MLGNQAEGSLMHLMPAICNNRMCWSGRSFRIKAFTLETSRQLKQVRE